MLYIDEHIFDFDLTAALDSISGQRRSQALRFRHEQGQRECVLAYLLLKRALKEEYGIDSNPLFGYGPHGKPFLIDHPGIHFSLSHCREAVAKLSGTGITNDIKDLLTLNPNIVFSTTVDPHQRYVCTMCRKDVVNR